MDFENIFLEKKELKRLRKLAKSNQWIKSVPTDSQLINKRLVEHSLFWDTDGNIQGWHSKIIDKGKDYLKYYDRHRNERRSDRLHDWLIAIASMIGGALLSEPLWNWIRLLFGSP